MNDDRRSNFLAKALDQFQFGNLSLALKFLEDHQNICGNTDDYIYWHRKVLDRYERPRQSELITVWQADPRELIEHEWLDYLVKGITTQDVVDGNYEVIAPRMLVIDRHLVAGKVGYYRQAYQSGSRILLVHLSDESFRDDRSIYRWCRSVFRNCYSPLIATLPDVSFFALGYNKGFARSYAPSSEDSRPYAWSFAGDPHKTSRPAMLQAMRRVGKGVEHLTSGFGASDALPMKDYRALMEQSVFVPCPAGYLNLDTFRVYEALEAGCIPIVERRPGFDYFLEAYGTYPFPSVLNWDEAATLIEHLQTNGLITELQRSCQMWWLGYKRDLAIKIRVAASLDR